MFFPEKWCIHKWEDGSCSINDNAHSLWILIAKLIGYRSIQNASVYRKKIITTGKLVINKTRVTLTYLPVIVNIKIKLL